ncbi:MAG: ABC transporter substrate-binding protein [Candidatus Methanomethylophilaceae archaeon]|nr:ABC transporter substrate-binding protein [Candidatus Methanomethylophilaceae archaeon]
MAANKSYILIAVAAVALVAVICATALFVANDNGPKEVEPTGNVKVFGNANNDDYIDDKDVRLLENLVSSGDWDKAKYPYADADNDGRITVSDVNLVRSIVQGKSCKVSYVDIYGRTVQVDYPVSHSRIGVSYWQQAELATLLGCWSDVVLASESTTSSNSHRYDTSNIQKSFKGSNITTELILECDCDLVIASQGKSDVVDAAAAAGTGVVPFYVDVSKSSTYVSTVLTLGALINENEKAKAYADYVNGLLEKLSKGMQKVDSKAKSVITLMYANQSTRSDIIIECEGTGAADMIGLISDVFDSPSKSTSNYRLNVEKDWFIENCGKEFDFVIIQQEGTDTKKVNDTYYTPEMYNERFEEAVTYYDRTAAYASGQLLGTTYSYNSFGGFANLMYLAYLLYPDVFSEEDGWKALQEYFDNFTTAKIDVKKQGGWFYTGTEYHQYNDRLAKY